MRKEAFSVCLVSALALSWLGLIPGRAASQ
jgi:hypothetical protein